MRAIPVAALVAALMLTGCQKDDDRRAVRDELLRLQVSLEQGVTPAELGETLKRIDYKTREAQADGALNTQQQKTLQAVMNVGKTFQRGWAMHFDCAREGVSRLCLPNIIKIAQALEVPASAMDNWEAAMVTAEEKSKAKYEELKGELRNDAAKKNADVDRAPYLTPDLKLIEKKNNLQNAEEQIIRMAYIYDHAMIKEEHIVSTMLAMFADLNDDALKAIKG
ncbi:MAG: hypothetical protein PW843_24375 [Azospirillaceae bacterium]|nr:hypothetical protein [Azospirillaceae bacterium]